MHNDVAQTDSVQDTYAGVPVGMVADGAPGPDLDGPDLAGAEPYDAEAEDDAEPEAENGFAALGLSEHVVQAVEEKGYRTPTPIQAQAIPTVLMGRDVLGVAQTGTGKTASFVLPMLDILDGSRARARMPRSLILEPTRELALQVAENFVQYGKNLRLNHALLIGGESMADQKEALNRGVDVLIATPGRLIDLFERGGLLLTDTRILVIDEADRMLDMGFIPDVERIVSLLPRTRQTMFFSATMAPEIKRLADAFLQDPKLISVSRPASVATTIVAGLTLVHQAEKREALRRMIRTEDVQNALIFCNRKRDVDILTKSLKRHGFSVGALHGDLSQPERFATLGKFKAGELRLLVCSDVAARGLDIGGLSHVFNFDVPIHSEDYVHRIGRTGRAGMTGHAYTLAAPDDRRYVEAIEKLVGQAIPRLQVEGLDAVEWSEDDGAGRRGRGRGKAAERPARTKATEGEATERPRRERTRRTPAKADEAAEGDAKVQVRAEPSARPARDSGRDPRRDQPRDSVREPARAMPQEAARDAPRDRQAEPAEDGSRDYARPREWKDRRDRGRDRYRRDDDLGPSIQGFGADIPAFMLIPTRRPAQTGAVSTLTDYPESAP